MMRYDTTSRDVTVVALNYAVCKAEMIGRADGQCRFVVAFLKEMTPPPPFTYLPTYLPTYGTHAPTDPPMSSKATQKPTHKPTNIGGLEEGKGIRYCKAYSLDI